MDIIRRIADALRGDYATYLVADSPGGGAYNPVVVKRPLLGEGNAPQYALLAQQITLASPAGGGTLVESFWKSINKGPTDFAADKYAVYFMGTLVQSRPLDPLLNNFKPIGPRR